MTLKPLKNVTAATDLVATYRCRCCKFKTLSGRGDYKLCPVCFWKDDGQNEHDADLVRGGPNGTLSLRQAKKNFVEYKATEQRFASSVRGPMFEEKRSFLNERLETTKS